MKSFRISSLAALLLVGAVSLPAVALANGPNLLDLATKDKQPAPSVKAPAQSVLPSLPASSYDQVKAQLTDAVHDMDAALATPECKSMLDNIRAVNTSVTKIEEEYDTAKKNKATDDQLTAIAQRYYNAVNTGMGMYAQLSARLKPFAEKVRAISQKLDPAAAQKDQAALSALVQPSTEAMMPVVQLMGHAMPIAQATQIVAMQMAQEAQSQGKNFQFTPAVRAQATLFATQAVLEAKFEQAQQAQQAEPDKK